MRKGPKPLMPLAIWPEHLALRLRRCVDRATWACSPFGTGRNPLCHRAGVATATQQHTSEPETLECGVRWVACQCNGWGHASLWHVGTGESSQLSANNAANSNSIGKQRNQKEPSTVTKSRHRPGWYFFWFVACFLSTFLPSFFMASDRVRERERASKPWQDAEKFILNEKLFQLHQRK